MRTVAVVVVFVAGCAGSAGPVGPQGERGERGPVGEAADVSALVAEVQALRGEVERLRAVPRVRVAHLVSADGFDLGQVTQTGCVWNDTLDAETCIRRAVLYYSGNNCEGPVYTTDETRSYFLGPANSWMKRGTVAAKMALQSRRQVDGQCLPDRPMSLDAFAVMDSGLNAESLSPLDYHVELR